MRRTKESWKEKRHGLQVGFLDNTKINNLRFADDVLLISTSLPHIREMLKDMIVEARLYGLELHPDKTKTTAHADESRQHRVPSPSRTCTLRF